MLFVNTKMQIKLQENINRHLSERLKVKKKDHKNIKENKEQLQFSILIYFGKSLH